MIQKATAKGNWWLAASSQNIPTHAFCLVQRFLAKHQITQVTQPHYSLDLVTCNFWLFSKLKSPLKGKRFQSIDEIQENTMGQLMAIQWKILQGVLNSGRDTGRTVWGPEGPTLKGTEVSLSFVQCFLHPVFSSINIFFLLKILFIYV